MSFSPLSPTMKHTCQESCGELCKILKCGSFLLLKSVNNVCKLLQLLGDFVPRLPTGALSDPGPHWGTSIPQTPWAIATPQIPGDVTGCSIVLQWLKLKVPGPVMWRLLCLSCEDLCACHVKAPVPVTWRLLCMSCEGSYACYVKAPVHVMWRLLFLSCEGLCACYVKVSVPVMWKLLCMSYLCLSCEDLYACHVKAPVPVMWKSLCLSREGSCACHVNSVPTSLICVRMLLYLSVA